METLAAVAPAPAAPSDTDAMRAALLGLNRPAQHDEPSVIEQPKPRRAKRVVRFEAEEPIEEGPTELTDSDFQAAIGGWRGLKSCLLESAQVRKEGISGAMRVSFVISSGGDVLETKVFDESNDAVRSMSECVERQARAMKFRAFTAADQVTKEAKFVF